MGWNISLENLEDGDLDAGFFDKKDLEVSCEQGYRQ